MKICYVGYAGRRIVGDYVWDRARLVHEIDDPELAAVLLSQPGNEFVVAADDPLLAVVGEETAVGLLAVEGVATVADLASLDRKATVRVAESLGVKTAVVSGWKKKAKAPTAAPEPEPDTADEESDENKPDAPAGKGG